MVVEMIKTYSEVIRLSSFRDRYSFLKLTGLIGEQTFGHARYLNQELYGSPKWRRTRNGIIIRDEGLDLACEGYPIYDCVLVHHINPISMTDIEFNRDIVYDPENLICTSLSTHNAIHFGTDLKEYIDVERVKNDTCPWK